MNNHILFSYKCNSGLLWRVSRSCISTICETFPARLFAKSFLITLTGVGLLVAGLIGCSPDSPKLMAPPEKYYATETDGGTFKVEFNPKVDILFLVDNSASMKDTQEALSHNIDRFVETFVKNEIVDFHIGVVSVFDSRRQKPEVPNFYALGQLRPVKNTKSAASKAAFITRETPDYVQALKSSIKLGVLDLWSDECKAEAKQKNVQPKDHCPYFGGPEYEELFSPVKAALSDPMRSGPNAGFYRPEAHLVVVLISDAKDSGVSTSAPELKDFLLNDLKGGNKSLLSVYGVLFPKDVMVCKSPVDPNSVIKADPSRGPDPTKASNNGTTPLDPWDFVGADAVMSMCDSNYGDRLAKIGNDIRRRTLSRIIHLPIQAEGQTIEVRYGSQVIPQNRDKGWTFNTDRSEILVSGNVEIQPEEDAQIVVRFVPINPNNVSNDRLILPEQ